ncbi:putative damage-inducible protein DinB [Pedobacter alluvionis]|uniref:DinB family protein n=2 Tax=Pedobacter alluvionis TaxID=475253 RepID=A0A497XXY9_9SPHI|nr:putative damage-inducible protein DinB [Pedobacter alluvionis]TFB28602.1 DinB family protein [Pedobacter alluvionis]
MSIANLLLMELHTIEKTNLKNMDIIKLLLKELADEFNTTKKFLAIVPVEKFDWAPHEKSMKMKSLAVHIADLPSWVSMALTTEGLDFETAPYVEQPVENADDLVKILEKNYALGKAELEKATEQDLNGRWVLSMGKQVLADYSKYETIRHSLSQTSHHRAQLGVYLRLLDIPIPGSYGPSADDQNF